MKGVAARPSKPDLEVLLDWFSGVARSASGLSAYHSGQFLLCARDLDIEGYHISRRLENIVGLNDPVERQREQIVVSFLRQIVLYRYAQNEEERAAFLAYWLEKRNRESIDIVSRAYLVGLALEQQNLVPSHHRDYVMRWYLRKREKLHADRIRGWIPHYLCLSGDRAAGREAAVQLLASRERNGSWRVGLAGTIGILYGLVFSAVVEVSELSTSIDYIGRRYDGSRDGDDGVDALALKTFFRLGLIDKNRVTTIRKAIGQSSTVFLCHTKSDKPFVRRLAKNLARWNVWLDEKEIKVGESIIGSIQDALRKTRFFVVVLSRESVQSRWVQKELNTALMGMLKKKPVLVLPVVLDDCEVPEFLWEMKYADFRASYETGLRELMDGLDAG